MEVLNAYSPSDFFPPDESVVLVELQPFAYADSEHDHDPLFWGDQLKTVVRFTRDSSEFGEWTTVGPHEIQCSFRSKDIKCWSPLPKMFVGINAAPPKEYLGKTLDKDVPF